MPRRSTTTTADRHPALVAFDRFTLALEDMDMLQVHLIARLEALNDAATDADDAAELRALTLIAQHVRDRHRRLHRAADDLLKIGDPEGAQKRKVPFPS